MFQATEPDLARTQTFLLKRETFSLLDFRYHVTILISNCSLFSEVFSSALYAREPVSKGSFTFPILCFPVTSWLPHMLTWGSSEFSCSLKSLHFYPPWDCILTSQILCQLSRTLLNSIFFIQTSRIPAGRRVFSFTEYQACSCAVFESY